MFVELNTERAGFLKQLKAEYPEKRIKVVEDECNSYLQSRTGSGEVDWSRFRALVFLDPFGMQVEWEPVKKLGGTGGVEIIINLPIWMAVQRLLKKDGDIPSTWRDRLNSLFGTEDWFDTMYGTKSDLFKENSITKIGSSEDLVDLYRNRLKDVFGYVTKAAVIRTDRKLPLYCLIHAGPNKTGNKIANYTMKMDDDWM